ncbi:MAG: glycosyltransferase family 39 protein [Ignavibacteria bacterium]|nr:glycosyltransferase family 39 protein [Ignavibacteria bacterium]
MRTLNTSGLRAQIENPTQQKDAFGVKTRDKAREKRYKTWQMTELQQYVEGPELMSANEPPRFVRPFGDLTLVASLALLKVLIHLPILHRYGYHHDELYFIACGEHFALGYVDHPPLVPWVARAATIVFGESLFGLRIAALLAGGAAVFVTGLLVRRLGGGKIAQGLACIAMLIAPVYLRTSNMLCIPAFEPLFWALASYLVVRIIQEGHSKLWIWVGLVIGLGLLNKHSMFFFAFGLLIALLLTPLRKHFRSLWLYLGGAVALVIFLPNVIWQMQNEWPTVTFLVSLNKNVMSGISLLQFTAGQLLYLHPLNAIVWISGLVWYFFRDEGRPYRALGWIWLSVFLLLVITKSKIYYLAPAYPALLAGGAILLEGTWRRWSGVWSKRIAISFAALLALVFVPISVPLLSVNSTEKFAHGITFGAFENIYEVTGDLRGMFGWRERVEAVAQVYNQLPVGEKEQAVIWGAGYGNVGAIKYFGKPYGLPDAVSANLSCWLWWTPPDSVGTVIAAGWGRRSVDRVFRYAELAAEIPLESVNPGDSPFRVWICREPRESLRDLWKRNRPW